jgi:hypothetical protein
VTVAALAVLEQVDVDQIEPEPVSDDHVTGLVVGDLDDARTPAARCPDHPRVHNR